MWFRPNFTDSSGALSQLQGCGYVGHAGYRFGAQYGVADTFAGNYAEDSVFRVLVGFGGYVSADKKDTCNRFLNSMRYTVGA